MAVPLLLLSALTIFNFKLSQTDHDISWAATSAARAGANCVNFVSAQSASAEPGADTDAADTTADNALVRQPCTLRQVARTVEETIRSLLLDNRRTFCLNTSATGMVVEYLNSEGGLIYAYSIGSLLLSPTHWPDRGAELDFNSNDLFADNLTPEEEQTRNSLLQNPYLPQQPDTRTDIAGNTLSLEAGLGDVGFIPIFETTMDAPLGLTVPVSQLRVNLLCDFAQGADISLAQCAGLSVNAGRTCDAAEGVDRFLARASTREASATATVGIRPAGDRNTAAPPANPPPIVGAPLPAPGDPNITPSDSTLQFNQEYCPIINRPDSPSHRRTITADEFRFTPTNLMVSSSSPNSWSFSWTVPDSLQEMLEASAEVDMTIVTYRQQDGNFVNPDFECERIFSANQIIVDTAAANAVGFNVTLSRQSPTSIIVVPHNFLPEEATDTVTVPDITRPGGGITPPAENPDGVPTEVPEVVLCVLDDTCQPGEGTVYAAEILTCQLITGVTRVWCELELVQAQNSLGVLVTLEDEVVLEAAELGGAEPDFGRVSYPAGLPQPASWQLHTSWVVNSEENIGNRVVYDEADDSWTISWVDADYPPEGYHRVYEISSPNRNTNEELLPQTVEVTNRFFELTPSQLQHSAMEDGTFQCSYAFPQTTCVITGPEPGDNPNLEPSLNLRVRKFYRQELGRFETEPTFGASYATNTFEFSWMPPRNLPYQHRVLSNRCPTEDCAIEVEEYILRMRYKVMRDADSMLSPDGVIEVTVPADLQAGDTVPLPLGVESATCTPPPTDTDSYSCTIRLLPDDHPEVRVTAAELDTGTEFYMELLAVYHIRYNPAENPDLTDPDSDCETINMPGDEPNTLSCYFGVSELFSQRPVRRP